MTAKKPRISRDGGRSRKSNAVTDKAMESADLRLLARDAALAALNRLADLSRSGDERVALAATQELLNRAFGKSSAAASEEAASGQPLIVKIVRFGETESSGGQGGGQS